MAARALDAALHVSTPDHSAAGVTSRSFMIISDARKGTALELGTSITSSGWRDAVPPA